MVTVPVKIIDNKAFDPTIEFSMSLSAPEDCEIGMYLDKCRVKIIDDDIFPSNKYAAELVSNPRDIHGLGLMWEYVKFNFRDKVVKAASIKWFLADMCDNIYYIWSLVLMRYLVDQGAAAIASSNAGSGSTDIYDAAADTTQDSGQS